MKNKIKTIIQYGAPLTLVAVLLIGYSESRSDYKEVGINCNLKALEWTQEMDRIESLYFYEQSYVTCMRSNGYLLQGFDYTLDTLSRN